METCELYFVHTEKNLLRIILRSHNTSRFLIVFNKLKFSLTMTKFDQTSSI